MQYAIQRYQDLGSILEVLKYYNVTTCSWSPELLVFMANSAMAIWNRVHNVYGNGSANEKMWKDLFVALDYFSSKAYTKTYQGIIPRTTH